MMISDMFGVLQNFKKCKELKKNKKFITRQSLKLC